MAGTLLGNENKQTFNTFSESIETLVNVINEEIKSRKESKGTGKIEDGIKLNDNKFYETLSLNIGEVSTNVKDIKERIVIQQENSSNIYFSVDTIRQKVESIEDLLSKLDIKDFKNMFKKFNFDVFERYVESNNKSNFTIHSLVSELSKLNVKKVLDSIESLPKKFDDFITKLDNVGKTLKNEKSVEKTEEPKEKKSIVKKASTSVLSGINDVKDFVNSLKEIKIDDVNVPELSKKISDVLSIANAIVTKVNVKKDKKFDDKRVQKYFEFISKSLKVMVESIKDFTEFNKSDVFTEDGTNKIGDKIKGISGIFNNIIGITAKLKPKDFITMYRNLIIIDKLKVGKMIGNVLLNIIKAFAKDGDMSERMLDAAKGAESVSNTLKNIFDLFAPKNILKNLTGVAMFSLSMKSMIQVLTDVVFDDKVGLVKLTDQKFKKSIIQLIGYSPNDKGMLDEKGNLKKHPEGIIGAIQYIIRSLTEMIKGKKDGSGLTKSDVKTFQKAIKELENVLIWDNISVRQLIEDINTFFKPKLNDISDVEKITDGIKSIMDNLTSVMKETGKTLGWSILASLAVPAIGVALFGFKYLFGKDEGKGGIVGIVSRLSNVAKEDTDFEKIKTMLNSLKDIFQQLSIVFLKVNLTGILAIPISVLGLFIKLAVVEINWILTTISKIVSKTEKIDIEKLQTVSDIFVNIRNIFTNILITGIIAIPTLIAMIIVGLVIQSLPKFISVINKVIKKIEEVGDDGLKEKVKNISDILLSINRIFVSIVVTGVAAAAATIFMIPIIIAMFGLGVLLWAVKLVMLAFDDDFSQNLGDFSNNVKLLMQTLLWYALSMLVVGIVFKFLEPFGYALIQGLVLFLAMMFIISLITLVINKTIGQGKLREFGETVTILMQTLLWYALGVLAVTMVFNYVSSTGGWMNLIIGLGIFLGMVFLIALATRVLGTVGAAGMLFFAFSVFIIMSSLLVFALGMFALYGAIQIWNDEAIKKLSSVIGGLLGVLWQNLGMLLMGPLAAVGMILLGAGLLMFALGLMVLHFAVDMWVKKDLIEQFKTLLKGIAEGINEMMDVLLGMPAGSNIGGTGAGGNVLDSFLGMFAAVFAAGAILAISVALLVFSVALLFLGLAVIFWQSSVKVEDLINIMVSVAMGVKLMVDALLGSAGATPGKPSGKGDGSVENQQLYHYLDILGSMFTAGSLVVVSVSLLVFSVALLILGKAIKYWDDGKIKLLNKVMVEIADAVKNMADTLLGKKEGGITGALKKVPLIGDALGAIGAAASAGAIVMISVALIAFGGAMKALGENIAIWESGKSQTFKGIVTNIGGAIKILAQNLDDADSGGIDMISDVSESLVIFAEALKKLGQINIENLDKLVSGKDGGLFKKVVDNIKKSLNSFSGAENEGMSNSIQSLQKTVNAIVKLCYGLQVLKSEDQLSNVALGVGKIQSTIEKTQPTPKALKTFSTIMYYLCKIAKSADGFERFTQSFKNFTKDMEKFKETLNGIDGDKLKDWVKLSEITLKLSEENQQFDKFATYFNEKFKEFKGLFHDMIEDYKGYEEKKAELRLSEFEKLKTAVENVSEEQRKAILDAYSTTDGTGAIVSAIKSLDKAEGLNVKIIK